MECKCPHCGEYLLDVYELEIDEEIYVACCKCDKIVG